MNDVGYDTSIKFIGSHLEHCINTSNTEGLKNLMVASENAVSFHTKKNNKSQIIFFSDATNLISKKLKNQVNKTDI